MWVSAYKDELINLDGNAFICSQLSLGGPWSSNPSKAICTPSIQVVASSQSTQEKWLIPRLGQGKEKMGLEQVVLPESKEVLKE